MSGISVQVDRRRFEDGDIVYCSEYILPDVQMNGKRILDCYEQRKILFRFTLDQGEANVLIFDKHDLSDNVDYYQCQMEYELAVNLNQTKIDFTEFFVDLSSDMVTIDEGAYQQLISMTNSPDIETKDLAWGIIINANRGDNDTVKYLVKFMRPFRGRKAFDKGELFKAISGRYEHPLIELFCFLKSQYPEQFNIPDED